MLRVILIVFLTSTALGIGYWGYQEHREKNAILLNAENNYQRAFHDLSYQVDLLHEKIGTTLAMNSRKSLSPALAEVWRITSQAHGDVGQLPLTLLPFNKTEEFLANIGNFSYKTAVRDLDKNPLSKKEYDSLRSLYTKSGDIQNELRKVQYLVLENNLRWMDVELALASGKETTDNKIIDGFKTVEKTVTGYDEKDLGPTFSNLQKKDENFKEVQGRNVSEGEAAAIAKKFMNLTSDSKLNVTGNGKGSAYGFYSITIKNAKSGEEGSMDITKKGGYPIWFINSRSVEKEKISLNEASKKAEAFLRETGFKNMLMFESSQYDHIGVFNFVTAQNDIRIYPESIKLKVAMDNGKVIGFSAEDYLKSHHARKLGAPGISKEAARKKVNPNLKIMEEHLSVIINDLNQEVLCYEILGTLGEDTYRIFINANNGMEEDVQKYKNAESVYQNAL